MRHFLKTLPRFFDAVYSGAKTFEVRRDDRGFQVGDELVLLEWDAHAEVFTGRRLDHVVGYILRGEEWGLAPGYVVLSLV